jgi:outer membrane protein TolC
MRRKIAPIVLLVGALALLAGTQLSPAQGRFGAQPEVVPALSASLPEGPAHPSGPPQAPPPEADRPLPINLATALRLADARPIVIEAARAAIETEYGRLQQANVLWLPTVYAGVDYQRHDGGLQNFLTGGLIIGTRNQFQVGAGAAAVFALTDAIYAPLAERQLVRARTIDVQTAKNDALLSVAVAYFDVQQARGILSGSLGSVAKARELARRVAALGAGLAPPIEVERVRATLEDLEQQAETARQQWRTSSADLTRVLRIDPAALVVPLEPPHVKATLISPYGPVDPLIEAGLTNRPELASQQAVVQATLAQLRQERMRPLLPSLVLQSNAAPDERLGVGALGSGTHALSSWAGRSDWDAQVVWELKNLGFGNRGLITQRRGEQRQAVVELFRIQDQVAADVRQAHAQVQAAAVRVRRAEAGLKAAVASYEGNLRGLSQTVRAGELLQLVSRPQEVVAALQQLQQSYINYYTSTNDYNRAQFQLFRAMGYAAQGLACSGSFGDVMPVDTSRPPQMAPVHAPEPCRDCPP